LLWRVLVVRQITEMSQR